MQREHENKGKNKQEANSKLSKAKKLQLSKQTKAALLTIRFFMEEQTKATMKEAKANLSKDF